MTNKTCYKYPQGYKENMVPWYTVLRRLVVIPFVAIGIVTVAVAIWVGYGQKKARDFLRDPF